MNNAKIDRPYLDIIGPALYFFIFVIIIDPFLSGLQDMVHSQLPRLNYDLTKNRKI